MIPFFKESLFWCKHVSFCLTVAVSLICKRRIAFVVIDAVGFFCLSLILLSWILLFSICIKWRMNDRHKKEKEGEADPWSLWNHWESLFFPARCSLEVGKHRSWNQEESNANRQADDQIEKWSRRWWSSSSHEKKDLSICLISCCCNYLKNTRERERAIQRDRVQS